MDYLLVAVLDTSIHINSFNSYTPFRGIIIAPFVQMRKLRLRVSNYSVTQLVINSQATNLVSLTQGSYIVYYSMLKYVE